MFSPISVFFHLVQGKGGGGGGLIVQPPPLAAPLRRRLYLRGVGGVEKGGEKAGRFGERRCGSGGGQHGPGRVYMGSACVPAHACVYPSKVCPHAAAVPTPRAPVGCIPPRGGHRTHGRGSAGKAAPSPPAAETVGTPPGRASPPHRQPCGEAGGAGGPAITPPGFR